MITLVLVKNPFSPRDGREVKKIEYNGTLAELLEENKIDGVDMLATVNGKTVDAETAICDGDFVVIYPAIEKGGGKGGKGILGIIAAVVLSVVSFGVGGLVATGVWGSFAGASAMAAMGGYLVAATLMFLGSSLIGRMNGQKVDYGSNGYGSEATYSWSGVQTMEGQNNPVALTYGVVKSGGQTIGKYTMASGSDEYLYWLVSAGEGEVEITDIKLNNNSISLFSGVSCEVRKGTNDQAIIPFFGDTHYTLPLSYNMEDLNTWYSAEAQGNAIQGVIIKIECPNGLLHTTDEGNVVENWIAVQIEIRKDNGSFISYNSFSGVDLSDWDSSKNALIIRGSSTKAIRKEYRIDRLPAGLYTARVRVTERLYSDVQRDTFATYFTGLSSIIYDDFMYPCTALIGIKAKASGQLSGSPTLTFKKIRGSIYAYNSNAREYQQKPANNPAWACYDLLHQCRYLKNVKTGRYEYEVRGVPANLMRYDDFAQWAAYCDSKHFNVNIEIVGAGEMLDVANERIAPIGHGMVVRFGTKYGCIFAHPQQAVQMFGMGNIIAGSFHEEFLKLSDRANCVEVTFTNEAADYQRDVITVYGETYDTDPYQKSAQVTMDGCTKYSQAFREGVYQLLCNKHQLRTVTFEADIDAIACTVGDVVIISHDVPRWQNSGRIETVDGNTVTFPCEVGDISATYVLQWRESVNDTLHERNCTIVSSADGWTTAELTTWQNDGQIESVEENVITLPCEVSDLSATYILMWKDSLESEVWYESYCTVLESESDSTTVELTDETIADTISADDYYVLKTIITTIHAGDIFSIAETGTEDKLYTVQSITRSQDFRRSVSCIEYDERVFAEPSNYDPDESQEIMFSVMLGQMANETLTITAKRGIITEVYHSSFVKMERGWFFDVEITPHSGYAVGSIIINGTSYGLGPVRNLPLNKDYLVTAQPAEEGATLYMDGTMDRFTSTVNRYYVTFSDVACTIRKDKGSVTGKLTIIDVSNGLPYWGTGILGDDSPFCDRAQQVREADIGSIDVSRKTDFNNSLSQLLQMQTIYGLHNWNPVSATSFAYLFRGDTQLTDFGDISHWSMPDLTTVVGMFTNLNRMESFDLHYWNTPALLSTEEMFTGCSNARAIDISGINTANLTTARNMFYGCGSLQYVILEGNDIKFSGNVTIASTSINGTAKFLVSDNMVNAYKTHANWSAYASRIDSVKNYTIIHANGKVTVTGG